MVQETIMETYCPNCLHRFENEVREIGQCSASDLDKDYPGSPFFMELGYFMLRRTIYSQFRTFEVTGTEKIPTDRGSMCSAWHTNGLVDPVTIFLSHPKKFVVGGRHDLVTRPILGFWARKFAVQPVVRKAEL